MSVRRSYFAGSFYPAEGAEVSRMIEWCREQSSMETKYHPKAIIVPHAGYIYSGVTASFAYRQLDASKRRVIVIGPSHRVAYRGMGIGLYDTYETPLGALSIDRAYAQTLQQRFNLGFDDALHQEHSTEVQMPFIKHYLPDAQVIEIVYGAQAPLELSTLIEHLLQEDDNLVVISTDLSHFYKETEANRLDAICLKAIAEEREALLHEGCEACGKIGVEAMILAAKRMGLASQLLDYRTSAWASSDTSRVVGYASALFF